MGRQIPGRPDGKDPLIYTGSVPNLVTYPRSPTVKDYEGYELGYWWIVPQTNDGSTPTKEIWILVGKQNHIATWKQIHGGGGPTNTLAVGNQYFTTPGSGTYTPTTGMVQCYVEVMGGGGGGFAGGNTGSYQEYQGGGGGGYAAKLYTAAQIGVSQPFFIGSGGAATTYNAPGPGNNGQNTTFSSGSLLITGQGGQSAVLVAAGYYNSFGGNGVGGDINIQGQCGGSSRFNSGQVQRGGDSVFGFGGYMETTSGPSTVAFNGQLYGGGGCGAGGFSTASAGAQGIIKVTEYFA